MIKQQFLDISDISPNGNFEEPPSRDRKPQDFHLFRRIENKEKITLPTNSKKDEFS